MSVEGGAAAGPGFGWTEEPLAAHHDVALLDLDGVVYVGPNAVPRAAESLDTALARHGMRATFVTNNAARPPAVVAAHLVELGVRAEPADVVISAQAGARVLAERLPSGSRVLAVGGSGVAWALAERGLVAVATFDDDPVAVMQGYGPDVGWRELAEACLAISGGAFWVATNMDRTIPSPRGRVLGNGALVTALMHATGVRPVVAGKPEPPLMLESVERSGATAPLVVGDRLDTDIEGATRSGIPALLVLTGVTDWADLLAAPAALRPTYVAHDLTGLLVPAPRVDVRMAADRVTVVCSRATLTVPVGRAERRLADDDDDEDGAGRRASWWLPDPLRGTGRDDAVTVEDVDLDAVRAVVAASWAISDAGMQVTGPSRLSMHPS